MDLILEKLDEYLLTPYVYPSNWPEDDGKRQVLTLFLLMNVGGWLLYIISASLSYIFIFDRRLMQHPLILKNQIRREITVATSSIPFMAVPTVFIFLLEVRGYSKLYWYDRPEQTWGYFVLEIGCSVVLFLLFTDFLIYWIHRGLHHKSIYKYLHKTHHLWKVPTPYASHAFHPIDGFLQSCPYHIYPFLFPLHKIVYLSLFLAVNFWTVSIHDGDYRVPEILKPLVNGSAHHTDHHLLYHYNYGQFFTLWDRIGGSFRKPDAFQGQAPIDYINKQNLKKE
ncbi:lathosterol oxidase-like [Dendronephthya gigantea]|uniref:lathosterol oxidase-like n=1 Tax=Dendronephthya gigantea TaxID=151771 RepID=UPI00106C2431|nr:lathosterol oxidase-like [Dendronephthya gigantea]